MQRLAEGLAGGGGQAGEGQQIEQIRGSGRTGEGCAVAGQEAQLGGVEAAQVALDAGQGGRRQQTAPEGRAASLGHAVTSPVFDSSDSRVPSSGSG